MKYLKKFFESKETPGELLVKYEDDIVKVLTTYYSTHTGDLCDQIDEILWNTSNVELDGWENDGVLTEEMMRGVVEDYKGAWDKQIEKLLNVYYDCRHFVKYVNKDLVDNLDLSLKIKSSSGFHTYETASSTVSRSLFVAT